MTDVNLNHGVGLNVGVNSLDIQGEQTGLKDANGNPIQPNNQATGLGVGAEYSFRVGQADRRFAFGAGLSASKTSWQQRFLATLVGEENFEPVQVDEPEDTEDDPFGATSAPSEVQNDASTDGVNGASRETMTLSHARVSVFGEVAYRVSNKATLALRAGISPVWFKEAYAPTSNRDGTNNYGLSAIKNGLLYLISPRAEVDMLRTKHGTLQAIATTELATGSVTAVSNGLSSDFRTIPGAFSVGANGGLRFVFGRTESSAPARTMERSKAQAFLTAYDTVFKEDHPGIEDNCGPIDPQLLDTATMEGYGIGANPLADILDPQDARQASAWYYSLGAQAGEERLASYADFAACDEQSKAAAIATATPEETPQAGPAAQTGKTPASDSADKTEEMETKTEPKKEGIFKKLFKSGKKKEQTDATEKTEEAADPAQQAAEPSEKGEKAAEQAGKQEAASVNESEPPKTVDQTKAEARAQGVPVQEIDFTN